MRGAFGDAWPCGTHDPPGDCRTCVACRAPAAARRPLRFALPSSSHSLAPSPPSRCSRSTLAVDVRRLTLLDLAPRAIPSMAVPVARAVSTRLFGVLMKMQRILVVSVLLGLLGTRAAEAGTASADNHHFGEV